MASQTKVAPSEDASAFAASSHVRSTGEDAGARAGHDSDGEESPPSDAPASALPRDDEDVSFDELLITDGVDDEPEDATEVHNALPRLVLEATEEAAESPPAATEVADAASSDTHGNASPPASQERALAPLDSEPQSESEAVYSEPFDLDESPEAAAARAAADQEAVAARAAAERAALEQGAPSGDAEVEAVDASPEPAPISEPLAEKVSAAENEPLGESAAEDGLEPPLAAAGVADDDIDVDPESIRAEELDAPLPSFDIPELESAAQEASDSISQMPPPRPTTIRPVAPMAPLSEMAEDDDDDAVTHIGLPVVPETPSDYPSVGAAGFAPAEPEIAALQGFDPTLAVDARRATTRVIRRVDPAELPPRTLDAAERRADTMRPLAASMAPPAIRAWLSRWLRRGTDEEGSASRRFDLRRMADNALPHVSLILLGSGIGAVLVMLMQPGADARALPQAQSVETSQAAAAATKRPTTLLERAEAGEGDALFKITNMAPEERTSELALALEAGHRAQTLNEFREFARSVKPRAGAVPEAVVSRLIGYATNSETMLPTLELLSRWEGSTGPDLLYAIWEKAPGGSRAQSLAQQLLHSSDQRAKASAALTTVLDLRAARTCDEYLRVLPAVIRSGDQRSSATLRALKHTDGCGDDGHQDCNACLRDGTQLDDALAAVERRPAPEL